jgi:hypothetical protein
MRDPSLPDTAPTGTPVVPLPAQMDNLSAHHRRLEQLVVDLAAHIKPHGLQTFADLGAAVLALGRAIPTRHDDNLQAVETER